MLDDISFKNCIDEDIPEGSDHLSCDFEKKTCSWYHDYTASLLWESSAVVFDAPKGNGECSTDYKHEVFGSTM